jgi:capsular exopolysaccharide synthesis family protein
MEIKYYAELLGRQAWFIIMLTILSGILALFITQYMPSKFEATSTVVITGRTSVSDLTPEMMQRLSGTYIELAQQQTVLEMVIDELALPVTVRQLRKQLRVSRVPESLLIELSVQDQDPQLAANIANTLVNILHQQGSVFLGNDPVLSRFSLHVVEAAVPPQRRVSPWPLLNVAVAVGIGAMAAIGIVLLNDYLDDSIHTSADASHATGLMNLATIITIRKGFPKRFSAMHTHATDHDVVVQHHPTSPLAEEYRLLRTHLEAASAQQDIRTLVLLSSSQGEGKSLTIANMAVVLAQAGKRVVLVDANLRQPRLHTLFDRPNTHGLTTVLGMTHSADSVQHMQSTNIDNLLLLTSGPLPPNPAELLGSSAMVRLLENLSAQADIVLCDTPALLDFSDATILSRHCDAAILVIQAGTTRSDTVRAALYRLDQFGIRTIGVLLNRAVNYTHSISTDFSYGLRRQSRQANDTPVTQLQRAAVSVRENGHQAEGTVSGNVPEPSLHIVNRQHNDG